METNEPLCGAVYRGPNLDVFFNLFTTHRAPKSRPPRFFRSFIQFCADLFYPVYDRNMANLKYSFDPPKATSFQIQLHLFPLDMFWVASLTYRVVAPTFFAQISLSFIIESAFDSFFTLTFRTLKFFFHAFILQCVSNFSNAIFQQDLARHLILYPRCNCFEYSSYNPRKKAA